MKIAIIEDEIDLAEALKEKLKDEGFDVVTCRNGSEAVNLIKWELPSVILLDLLLPEMNGFEVLETIKADENLKRIPVIVLSNLDQDEDIKRALRTGAEDYFVKTQHPLKEVVEKVKAITLKTLK